MEERLLPKKIKRAWNDFLKAVKCIEEHDLVGLAEIMAKHPELINERNQLYRGYSLLHYAVIYGIHRQQYELISYLIDEAKADVNVQDTQNFKAAIHWAAQFYDVTLLEILVNAGADVNIKDRYGANAMNYAVSDTFGEVICAFIPHLVKYGVDINNVTGYGSTALSDAMTYTFCDVIVCLIKYGAVVNNEDSPLCCLEFMYEGHLIELLEFGVRVDTPLYLTRNNEKITPLRLAVELNELSKAKILLDYGADPLFKYAEEESAFECATSKGHTDMVELFKRYIDGQVEIKIPQRVAEIKAQKKEDTGGMYFLPDRIENPTTEFEKARFFIQENDLSALSEMMSEDLARQFEDKGVDAYSLLHFATSFGMYHNNKEIILYLISFGMDVNVKSKECFTTPLHLVASECNADFMTFLLSLGADTESRTDYGSTPMHYLCSYHANEEESCKCIEILQKHGADINAVNDGFSTPLFLSIENFRYNIMRFLVEKGAIVDHMKLGSNSPLFTAYWEGEKDTDIYLLKHGANLDAPVQPSLSSTDNKTLLHYMVEFNNLKYLKVLLSYGADPLVEDSYGKTPLYYAVHGYQSEMVKALQNHIKPKKG